MPLALLYNSVLCLFVSLFYYLQGAIDIRGAYSGLYIHTEPNI